MQLKSKHAGIILVIVAVILFILVYSYTLEIFQADAQKCKQLCGTEHEATCPHTERISLPIQTYLGVSLIIIILILAFSQITSTKAVHKANKELARKLSMLHEDEKKIYKATEEAEGTIFQSELIEKTGFSKVKVSRVLDRLEGKGLIERRRRGMTNIVILKH